VGLRVATRGVDREDFDPAAFQLETAHRAQHRLVLSRPGHHRCVGRKPAAGAEQGEVHSLGARRCEDDLGRVDAEGAGGLVAGPVEGVEGRPALGMGAGRVAGRDARQGRGHLGQDAGARGVVEVDAAGWSTDFDEEP